jgi:hypothetical protein
MSLNETKPSQNKQRQNPCKKRVLTHAFEILHEKTEMVTVTYGLQKRNRVIGGQNGRNPS